MSAINGGSGNSTTPQTTQNRCYPSDSEAAATGGDGAGNGFYVCRWCGAKDGEPHDGAAHDAYAASDPPGVGYNTSGRERHS